MATHLIHIIKAYTLNNTIIVYFYHFFRLFKRNEIQTNKKEKSTNKTRWTVFDGYISERECQGACELEII